jgi:ligand-binding sensor domain-containing protein
MKEKLFLKYFRFLFSLIIILLMSLTAFICDKEVTVSPPPPPVAEGFLSVQSNPEGSTIFLNGRNTGRITPDSLNYLDYGTYQVTLKRQYFRDTTIYVNISEGSRVDTSIDYLSNPLMYGSLNVNSSPTNSRVFINDSLTGYTTPATIRNIIPGLYKITLEFAGFRDAVINNVRVESNVTRTVYAELEDTTQWVIFQVSNSNIPSNILSCITSDLNGIKWIGTFEHGVLKFDGSNFTEYNMTNSPLPDNYILCLAVDPANRLWVGTDNGLAELDNGSWTVYTKDNSGLPINSIKSLAPESNNILWIGTSLGLVKYDGSWQVYTISPDITNWVTTISIDQANNKWIGISDTSVGIFSFDGTTFTNYPREEYGYPTKNITCSAVSPFGLIWFGCSAWQGASGGLTYYDGNSFTNVNLSSFLLANNIFIDNSDIKWISANDGIYEITGTSVSNHYQRTNSPLPSNDIRGSVKDNEGNLWIATGTAGLVKYKGAQ